MHDPSPGPELPPWIDCIWDALDDAVVALDRHWRFQYLNRRALHDARKPLEALLGQSIWDHFPHWLGTPVEDHYRRALTEQTPAHFEMPGLADGLWLEVHVYPCPEGLIVFARDATERKRAEEALRASEERFRQMAEALDDVFWMTDITGNHVLYVNPAFETLWGRSCQSLYDQPRSWLEAVHPEDLPRVRAAFDRLASAGGFREEYRIVRPDGSQRWVQDRAFPVRGTEGRVSRFVGMVKDVTERRQAEEALRDSEERLRGFFEAAFEGILLHDGTTVLDANQALADLFGYPLAEVIGMPVLDLLAPESRAEVRRRILTGEETLYEAVERRKDGSTFPAEVCGKSILYRGRPARVTALRDISKRRRAEQQVEDYAGRLRDLSRRLLQVQEEERRRLARELHDEVAQVLTGLHFTLELSSRTEAARRETSLTEARRLVRELMGQVRDISLLLRPSLLDDLGLVPALHWHCERYSLQTGVRVAFTHAGLEGRLPAEVETAAFRIVQEALTNIARHAQVDEAVVRAWAERDVLHLEVRDRGAGFDAVRVLQAPAGIGLAGMQERAGLLDGRLTIESAPGAGTCLQAELPTGRDHPAAK